MGQERAAQEENIEERFAEANSFSERLREQKGVISGLGAVSDIIPLSMDQSPILDTGGP